jgi:hypothetical protein
MTGFETVVRPVVLPNIRPQPALTLPPADDPEKGFCTIRGNPAKEVNLTTSWSSSTSRSHQVETQRRFDEVRVYQQNDDGSVNKDNFVDVEVANKIWQRGGKQPAVDGRTGTDPGVIGGEKGSKGDSYQTALWYAREIERENTEIRKRDEIRKNKEAKEGE